MPTAAKRQNVGGRVARYTSHAAIGTESGIDYHSVCLGKFSNIEPARWTFIVCVAARGNPRRFRRPAGRDADDLRARQAKIAVAIA